MLRHGGPRGGIRGVRRDARRAEQDRAAHPVLTVRLEPVVCARWGFVGQLLAHRPGWCVHMRCCMCS